MSIKSCNIIELFKWKMTAIKWRKMFRTNIKLKLCWMALNSANKIPKNPKLNKWFDCLRWKSVYSKLAWNFIEKAFIADITAHDQWNNSYRIAFIRSLQKIRFDQYLSCRREAEKLFSRAQVQSIIEKPSLNFSYKIL